MQLNIQEKTLHMKHKKNICISYGRQTYYKYN